LDGFHVFAIFRKGIEKLLQKMQLFYQSLNLL